jgi:hypothetical protein
MKCVAGKTYCESRGYAIIIEAIASAQKAPNLAGQWDCERPRPHLPNCTSPLGQAQD